MLEFDGASDTDLTHRYLWGPAVDQILADEQVTSVGTAGDVIWPLTDHLGTTRDLLTYNTGTDTTALANHRRFDSFGNIISETNSSFVIFFGFTGRPFDVNSGLQNNWHRWYISHLGVWASEDPIGFSAKDSNLRRYVANAALSQRDSTGLWADPLSPDSTSQTFWAYVRAGKITEATQLLKDLGVQIASRKGVLPSTGLLQRIYQLYPAGKKMCDVAASKVMEVLRLSGDKIQMWQIQDKFRAMIFKTPEGIEFADTGKHIIVYNATNGRVYDALTGPLGMPIAEYLVLLEKMQIIPVWSQLK